MYRIIILLTLSLNIFANNLVDIYRLEGIQAVEQKLEENLKDLDYWKNYLADKNVDYGYYETKKYVVLTQKEIKELSLYKNENFNFSLVSRSSIIVGEKEGDKYIEGDKKTPEGAYDLLNKKSDLDQFYGPFALVTSYPNTFDKSLNKKGHGIWIHGMPLNEEREKYTRGCIALDNPQLEELEKNINLDEAILLTSHAEFVKPTKDEMAQVLTFIYKWKDSWTRSNTEEYLNHYSLDFKKQDGSGLKKFSRHKKRIFAKKERKRIRLWNIDVAPYPNSLNKKMFRIVMDEDYKSTNVKFLGKKELFIELLDGEVKILAED